MAFYYSLYGNVSWSDWFKVIWHGLPLDLSIAAYFTIVPALMLIVSVWLDKPILYKVNRVYYLLISIIISIVSICDLALYGYWGFRLDTTPLFYFLSSPKDALASVSFEYIGLGLIAIAADCCFLYATFLYLLDTKKHPFKIPFNRLTVTGVLTVLTALLFVPIRGGLTVSTMNLGKVYFSENQRLNHAAINPLFSLIDSFTRQENFANQYRFFSKGKNQIIFDRLTDKPQSTPLPKIFNNQRPNIIFVVLESFSAHLMPTLGGEPIAMNLEKIAKQGILFTNFYANSFRTDRGLVSILSGYPAQPTTSIMKYTHKTQNLPSIPASLKKVGYQLNYYYGGDADFTNMRSYVLSMGIEHLICDHDFPASQRLSKWGAHDDVVFKRLLSDLRKRKENRPFFTVLQTSSSHEPFDVPYHKLANKGLNAFAYTDSCVGDFIRQLKTMPIWKNTVVVLVPDHLGVYPENVDFQSSTRYHIPLILTGGAVIGAYPIPTYGSQADIAATLLAQLNLPHSSFTFSKNMLNINSPHFAFFTFPNLFGVVTADNEVVYNCDMNRVVVDKGKKKGKNLNMGKAYLQSLYDDLAKR